jgi:signal transduction histidine kinase
MTRVAATKTAAAATMVATTETTAEPTPRRRLFDLGSLGPRPRRPVHWTSLRTRILAWFIGVLALATVASVIVTREVLLIRLDQRVDAELTQEAAELRKLATGNDPETGRPFGSDVRRIFDVYLERNVPSRNEAFVTFVAGDPFLRSRPQVVVDYWIDRDPELVALWADVTRPARDRAETPAGRVEYIAVPLKVEGQTAGVFVAAIFRDRLKGEADAAFWAALGVGLAVLLLGSLFAWRLADRVIRPVAALTATARSISETDLGQRIPLEGKDEVAQLAGTFNEMLDRLERAFDAQRDFVDDAGHELRTPITVIRGHLELLDADPVDRERTLGIVIDELDRMARIVEDLQLLAKHEQPGVLNLETVDVGALTREIHAKAQALGPHEWRVENRGCGIIVADRHRLTQAIMQLAENAVYYSEPGAPIVIGSNVWGGEARIWVRDQGEGIPFEDQEHIFERFRRGAGQRRSEGAGLGLAIVKAIVEAHHGSVQLQSRAGGGSTFTIIIPVDQPLVEGDRR